MSDEKDKKEEAAVDEEKEAPEETPAPAADAAPEAPAPDAQAPAAAAPMDAAAQPAPTPVDQSAPATSPDQQNGPGAAPQMSMGAPAPQGDMGAMTITPQQEAAQKTQENLNFYQDASQGKVHPKTYADLFNDKSMTGKLGTIFGMMLSGAGSGLTHQPNALLDMMNKQIERDVEAQKENLANKRSWYALAMQHEKQQPEIALMNAQAQKAGSEADKAKYNNALLGITDLGATTQAINASSASFLADQQNVISRMAPGPKRDAFQQQLDQVALPAFLAKAQERNLETAQQKALIKSTLPQVAQGSGKGNPPPTKGEAVPGVRYDAYNQSEFARRSQLGRQLGPDAGMSKDAIPAPAAAQIASEAVPLTANRATYADAVKSFSHLSNMPQAGEAPASSVAERALGFATGLIPGGHQANAETIGLKNAFEKERNTQMEALIGKMARGNISSDEARKIAESWMPSWLDSPEQRDLKFEQLKNHFTSMPEEGAPTTKQYGLYYPPPKYNFKAPPGDKNTIRTQTKNPYSGRVSD